jgi:hypothetical protein
MPFPAQITDFQLSSRAALAAGMAVEIARLLHLHYPIYALIGAVIVTDLAPAQTQRLALRRSSAPRSASSCREARRSSASVFSLP